MNHNDIIEQLIEDGITTYTVYAVPEWTNRIVDMRTYVPADGIHLAADDMLFKAWEGEYQTDSAKFGTPQTCAVYVVPTAADSDKRLRRFTRHIATYIATSTAGPSPSHFVEPDDPTLGEARKVLGPYSD